MHKKTLTILMSITLLITALFVGCNADASAGLFRQIAESTAPVGIIYRQITGRNSGDTELYFLTTEGLYKTDGTTSTELVANSADNIIRNSYYDSTNDLLVYQTNDDTFNLYTVDPADSSTITTISTFEDASIAYDRVVLYQNGLVMVTDSVTNSGSYLFDAYEYDETDLTTTPVFSIDTSTLSDDYYLSGVLQMSGSRTEALSDTYPMIVSLVGSDTDDPSYLHYFVDGTDTPFALSSTTDDSDVSLDDLLIASFRLINDSGTYYLYLLTVDGELYGTSVSALADLEDSTTTFTLLYDNAQSYDVHAFMYDISDGTDTYIITKPNSINKALYVITFPDGTYDDSTDVDMTTIRNGYGEYLDSVEIVDSYVKSSVADTSANLLVASNENGMFEINILAAYADVNSTTNGDSSISEDYTID